MKATGVAPVVAALTLLVPGLALAQAPKPATSRSRIAMRRCGSAFFR